MEVQEYITMLTCGIPTILWQASICCITSGREGAAKTIFPTKDAQQVLSILRKSCILIMAVTAKTYARTHNLLVLVIM